MSATAVACPQAGSLVSSHLMIVVVVSAARPCTDGHVLCAPAVPGQGQWVIVLKGSWQDCQGCWGLFSRKSRGMAKSRFSAQSMLLLEGLQMPHERVIDVFFHPSASLFQGTEAE